MASLEHQRTPPSEADLISGEKPGLSHTVSAGAISISPELFEKVCYTLLIQLKLVHRLKQALTPSSYT